MKNSENNQQNKDNMNRTLVFTPQVLNTLRSLPYEERLSLASAMATEMLLGAGTCNDLQPEEDMIYSVIRYYVKQASDRYESMIG